MSQTIGNPVAGALAWRPTPVLVVSALVHAAGFAMLAAHPEDWPLVLCVLAANHLVVFLAVLCPRGRMLGPNIDRLPADAMARGEVSLTFDDGPDPQVTPAVLDLLDRYRMRASFFCIGEKAAAHPELVREIARRGHSLENHSQCHSAAFAFFGLGRLGREVESVQRIIAELGGRPPSYFRAPMGLRSPFLDPVLARCGLRYVSWTRRGYDGALRDPARVLRCLTDTLAAGDILVLHDTAKVRTSEGVPVVLAVLPPLLERITADGLVSVTLPASFHRGRPG